MALLDKLTDAAATFSDKASDAIETTKLKSKINSEKKAVELELAEIGRIYYEKMKAGEMELTEEATDISGRVDAHYEVIAETEKTLKLYEGK